MDRLEEIRARTIAAGSITRHMREPATDADGGITQMLKDGFLRFCDNPEIACCKAEKELERLRNENAALRIQLSESQRREKAAAEEEPKQEREMGCEYCADHEDLAFGHDSMNRVGSIYIDGNLLVADLYSESMAVAVCFCPMCGKTLKEETHD